MLIMLGVIVLLISINNIILSVPFLVIFLILYKPFVSINFSAVSTFLFIPVLSLLVLLILGREYSASYNVIVAYFVFCFYVVIFSSVNITAERVLFSIDIAIKAHLFFYFLQLFCLYFLNFNIDYSYYLSGEENRVHGGLLSGVSYWRPSGLYNEPGTYATYFSMLLYLSFILHKCKPRLLHLISLLSLFSTISVFAFILSIPLVYRVIFFRYNGFFNKIKFPLFGLFLVPICYIAFEYLYFRFFSLDRYDVSLDVKLNAIDFWLNQDFARKLLGSGLSFNDYGFLIDDSTLAFVYVFTYGVFAIPIFYTIMKSRKEILIFTLFILLSKTAIFSVFWGAYLGFIKNKNIRSL